MKYGLGSNEYNYYKTIDNGKTWEKFKEDEGNFYVSNENLILIDGLKRTKDNFYTLEILDFKGTVLGYKDSWFYVKKDKNYDEIKGEYFKTKEGDTFIPIKGPSEIPLETDLFLYIINDILIPDLTFMLTNHTKMKELNFGYFKNGELFYTNKELYKSSINGIDYINDIGMKPLTEKELNEYKQFDLLKKELNEELKEDDVKDYEIEEELLKNDILSKTFNIIDLKLKSYKDLIIKVSLEKTESLKEDYTGLKPSEVSVMKMYYDIRKGAEESINGTIINSIFSFNNSKKMALLKESIYNSIFSIKDNIHLSVSDLEDMLRSGVVDENFLNDENLKKAFKFDLRKLWIEGLDESIKNYYKRSVNNIYSLSENDDREYINIAIDNYKNTRSNMLNYISDLFVKSEYINLLNNEYINSFLNDSSIINNNFVSQITECIINDNIPEIEKIYLSYVENENSRLTDFKDHLSNYIYDFKDQLINILNDQLDKKIKEEWPNIEEGIEDNISLDNYKKIYNYYIDIIKKLKERSCILLEIIFNEIVNYYVDIIFKDSLEIEIWINNLILSDNKLNYLSNNNLNYLDSQKRKYCEEFNGKVKKAWSDARNII